VGVALLCFTGLRLPQLQVTQLTHAIFLYNPLLRDRVAQKLKTMNYKVIADSLKQSLMVRKKLLLTAVAAIGVANTTIAQTVPSYVPSNGLVGWWPFNGNANDESGNGNNGAVNGATLTVDRFGNANKAFSFNGVNQYITSNCPNIPIGNNSRTISFWMNVRTNIGNLFNHYTGVSWGEHVTSRLNDIYIYSSINGNANTLRYCGNFDDLDGKVNINNNQWHFYLATYDGNNAQIYFDGVLINSGFFSNWNTTYATLYFGWDKLPEGYLNGKMDDIGIWNRVLNQKEITDLYNGGICYQHVTVTDTLRINTTITGFNPVTYQNSIKIWPNPTKDHITIDNGNIANLTGHQIKISNALGQQVFQSAINQKQFYVDMSSWGGHGIYFVNIINAQGVTIETKKIVLE